MTDKKDALAIIEMERAAFDRWAVGDPSGFLEISDESVTYFDPYVDKRLEGLAALRSYYEPFRGKFRIDRWEMLDPQVQVAGEVGVLSFNFESHGSEGWKTWHTTEVYRKTRAGWRIIHTHWSVPNSPMAA